MTLRTAKWWLGVGLGVGLTACGDDPAAPAPGKVELTTLGIGAWYAAPGELEALQQVMDSYKAAHSDVLLEVVAVDIDATKRGGQYHTGIEGTVEPVVWDMGLQTQPFIGDLADVVMDLGALPELEAPLATVNPALSAVIKPPQTKFGPNTATLGLPMSITRLNTLHRDLQALPTAPQTLQDYRDICQNYIDNGGPKPIALTAPDNSSRHALQVLLGLLTPAIIFGTEADPRTEFTAVLELMKFYRDNGCFLFAEDPTGPAWDNATQALIDGNALMDINAGWATGYLVANGRVPGQDFATSFARADGAYIYTVEILTANAATPHKEDVVPFMQTALSPAAQLGFSRYRGSVPAVTITNPDTEITDVGVRASYDDFVAAGTTRAGTQRPWISDNGKTDLLLKPFFKGESDDVAAVVEGYLCTQSPACTAPMGCKYPLASVCP